MREIKFKAKTIDNGMWVYGSYTCMEEDNNNNPFRQTPYKKYHRIWQYEPGDWNMGGYANYEVLPETVCQWTGLLDKQGVKIFEGDIFRYRKHDRYLLPDFTGEVLFMMGCFGYVATSENMGEAFRSFSEIDELKKDFLDHIEVTGNIHDNAQQKQALSDMMRGDEEIGLYDDNQKNH